MAVGVVGDYDMINKIAASVADALADVKDGATILVGGFGTAGIPDELIDGLIEQGATDLTVVNNNGGSGAFGLAGLLKAGRVRKVICSYPRQVDNEIFEELYRSGKLELELVPQGNLAERIRAAGAGIGAFFRLPATAPSWPETPTEHPGKRVKLTAAITCWKHPFTVTLRSSRRSRGIVGVI